VVLDKGDQHVRRVISSSLLTKGRLILEICHHAGRGGEVGGGSKEVAETEVVEDDGFGSANVDRKIKGLTSRMDSEE
jgi:hypothetical protein